MYYIYNRHRFISFNSNNQPFSKSQHWLLLPSSRVQMGRRNPRSSNHRQRRWAKIWNLFLWQSYLKTYIRYIFIHHGLMYTVYLFSVGTVDRTDSYDHAAECKWTAVKEAETTREDTTGREGEEGEKATWSCWQVGSARCWVSIQVLQYTRWIKSQRWIRS